MKSGTRSASVDKAFELVRAVADKPGGLSLSSLSAVAGIAPSTCHRYVTTLLDLAVLERDSGGRFRLGLGLVALASQCLGDVPLRELAAHALPRLVELSGETAHVAAPLRDSIVYVDKAESEKSIRMVSRVGSQAPMYCTSMGKAMLAYMPRENRDRILQAPQQKRTSRTKIGIDLDQELDRVRFLGYAIDDEENEDGVRCLGVPIIARSGVPVGALSVSGPAVRFSMEDCVRLAPEAMALARQIGRRVD